MTLYETTPWSATPWSLTGYLLAMVAADTLRMGVARRTHQRYMWATIEHATTYLMMWACSCKSPGTSQSETGSGSASPSRRPSTRYSRCGASVATTTTTGSTAVARGDSHRPPPRPPRRLTAHAGISRGPRASCRAAASKAPSICSRNERCGFRRRGVLPDPKNVEPETFQPNLSIAISGPI